MTRNKTQTLKLKGGLYLVKDLCHLEKSPLGNNCTVMRDEGPSRRLLRAPVSSIGSVSTNQMQVSLK